MQQQQQAACELLSRQQELKEQQQQPQQKQQQQQLELELYSNEVKQDDHSVGDDEVAYDNAGQSPEPKLRAVLATGSKKDASNSVQKG